MSQLILRQPVIDLVQSIIDGIANVISICQTMDGYEDAVSVLESLNTGFDDFNQHIQEFPVVPSSLTQEDLDEIMTPIGLHYGGASYRPLTEFRDGVLAKIREKENVDVS